MGPKADSRAMADFRRRQQEVGERIAAAVSAAGISQDDLAPLVRRSQGTVSRWVLGKSVPEWEVIRPLAKALGVSAIDLMWPLLAVEDQEPSDVERAVNNDRGLNANGRISVLTFYRSLVVRK